MSRALNLGPALRLEANVATASVAVLGQKGSGKSNAAVVFAEELWDAGVPWVAIDPKGDWWGVRSSVDGKGAGLPVPIIGGLHGDLPLEASAGAFVADLLVDQALTALLDVSELSQADLVRFLVAFCHRLFQRHRRDPQVRTVIFEEAHRYIPQNLGDVEGGARVKEATAKIPLEGRAFGLGSLVCSQRSSRLHKDVLTQSSIVVAMRSPAELDRKAIGGWIAEHGARSEVLDTLGTLKDGEAWWLDSRAVTDTRRVTFRRRRTFDSGATPEVGRSRATPRTLADVDLAAIKEQMAETIEKAKADDPAELRRQVRILQRELAERPTSEPVVVAHVPPDLLPLVDGVREVLVDMAAALDRMGGDLANRAASLEQVHVMADQIDGGSVPRPRSGEHSIEGGRRPTRPSPREQSQAGREMARHRPAVVTPDVDLPGGAPREILRVLVQHGQAMTPRRAGWLAGFSSKRGDVRPLPTGDELLAHWRVELGEGAPRRLLDVMVRHYPKRLDQDRLAEQAGIGLGTSTLRNAMSNLRRLGIVEDWRLSDDFVEAVGL